MKQFKLIAVLFLAATASSYGTVYYQNEGNAGSTTEGAGHGSVTHLSSPSYSGSGGCVDANCIFKGGGTRYHSEWGPVGGWNSGTRYFGYAIYLPSSFKFTGSQRAVTEQYGTRKPGGGTINPDWYQAWIKGNSYQFGGGGISDHTTGTMNTGTWHRIVTRVTYGGGGSIQAWFDGSSKWTQSGTINGGGGGNPNGLWALGLYEADWDGSNTGNGTNVSVYDAKARITSSYNEANPSGW